MMEPVMLPPLPLPAAIRSRVLPGINGLAMHILEAGHETPGRPCLLLLHGFPELAYSWRKVMPPLAALGYHVVAPDQRGYGRTTGWQDGYDAPLEPFRLFNLVRDVLGLLHALGHARVAAVVGHDFGSPVAAWCALLRPDVFPRLVLMSAPFAGPPRIGRPAPTGDVHAGLAALPRPRKHYQWYYSTPRANADMLHAPQGLHAFLRAYYHHKSADWPLNRPRPLAGWTAEALAELPTYYVMDLAEDMAATVAHEMPTAAAIAANRWLPDEELAVYAAEYARTGFQGGLQWYRCRTTGRFDAELELFSGRTIDVPARFIAGAQDWGIEQVPGALAAMHRAACTAMPPPILIEGAGHWVQQEQPEAVVRHLADFLAAT
jgi:pimeloyl-ACP methyl ester carboxylesterase